MQNANQYHQQQHRHTSPAARGGADGGHVARPWTCLEEVPYQRYAAGTILHVAAPGSRNIVDTVPSEAVLETLALVSPRRPLTHCTHFLRRGSCVHGPRCKFMHVVRLVAPPLPGPYAPGVVPAQPKQMESFVGGAESMLGHHLEAKVCVSPPSQPSAQAAGGSSATSHTRGSTPRSPAKGATEPEGHGASTRSPIALPAHLVSTPPDPEGRPAAPRLTGGNTPRVDGVRVLTRGFEHDPYRATPTSRRSSDSAPCAS